MLLMSGLWINLFWGGFLPFFNFLDFVPGFINFSLKMCFISFIFVFVRANLPRYRYDQFMNFGWKILLPASFAFFVLSILVFLVFDMFPEVWYSFIL
jgi:NADH-quinone oxidoreductase subunit H